MVPVMFLRLLPVLAVLCACASPSPQFFGAKRQEVVVDGRQFTVFQDQNRVQVVRHGYARPAARRDIPDQMMRAVLQATGCAPQEASFQGDSGEMRGRVKC